MAYKDQRNTLIWVLLLLTGGFLLTNMSSCGKGAGNASPTGLNIQYEVLNLSPDLGPINLFVKFTQVNTAGNPFIFGVNQGYFYVPATDTPYQFRSGLVGGAPIPQLNSSEILKSGAKYSLFITGSLLSNTLDTMFTVDTSLAPKTGYGKLRFLNASPSATGGLDVYANGTSAFSGIVYRKHTDYMMLPAGNYDLQIDAKGTKSILSEQQAVTIQDGRLYTLYAYGYTTVVDSASFGSAVITNK